MQARWYDPGAGRFLSVDPLIRQRAAGPFVVFEAISQHTKRQGLDMSECIFGRIAVGHDAGQVRHFRQIPSVVFNLDLNSVVHRHVDSPVLVSCPSLFVIPLIRFGEKSLDGPKDCLLVAVAASREPGPGAAVFGS